MVLNFGHDIRRPCLSKVTKLCYLLIIGNGPSAICLSHLLSGNWPYYSGDSVPDPLLNDRMEYFGTETSLIEQVVFALFYGNHSTSC